MLRQFLVVALGLGVAVGGAACGGSKNPGAPGITAPSPSSSLSVSVSPVPVPTRAQRVGSSVRYDITGDVLFRDAGGAGGRITQLQLALVTGSGDAAPRTVGLDLAVPPGGTAHQSIAQTIELSTTVAPVNLRVGATASDGGGRTVAVDPVDVPVAVSMPADSAPDVVFVGAGDIAVCGSNSTAATARLLDRIPGTVFTLGDNVYPTGTAEQFANCYEPTWGRHRSRTYAAPGNHDWDANAGAPYFAYFGVGAGPGGLGYYSFNLGGWHILSLNSNVPAQAGSAQYEWARADLAASGGACTLAFWHHPLFTSGPNGNTAHMRDMWRLLQSYGAEFVMSGHDHEYERFAPQDADGRPDPRGLREFVVGTGGAPLYNVKAPQPNSELRESQTWGVLRLTLHARSYDWEFVPIDGQSFRDRGSDQCR